MYVILCKVDKAIYSFTSRLSFSGSFEQRSDNQNDWRPVLFDKQYGFELQDGQLVHDREVQNTKSLVTVQREKIECPSIVFVRLQNDNSEVYNFVKLLSNLEFGVQSQCFVQTKYSSQRNPDQ